MRLIRPILALALLVVTLDVPARADAGSGDYLGKTFRVTGVWTAPAFTVHRIQLRERDDDPTKAQIIGRVSAIDREAKRLRIGPLDVAWLADSAIDARELAALKAGDVVRVSGRVAEAGGIVASTIEPRPTSGWPADDIQITGTAREAAMGEDGALRLTLLGLPTRVPRLGYNRDESLTRRQDARRPDLPFKLDVAGRPLRITGEYDMTLRERRNYRLDDRDDRNVRDDIAHEFQLEFFLPWSEHLYFFAELKAFYESEFYRSDGRERSRGGAFSRGQAWVYIDGFAQNRLGFQIGRQNLREVREWWWDDDLDAVRAVWDDGPLHVEAGVARELARVAWREPGIDPQEKDVNRYFAHASWLWAPRQTVEAFLLHHDDRSGTHRIGSAVAPDDQDASDARLTWVGLRAMGQRSLERNGTLRYWADTAWVFGSDRVSDFDDDIVQGHRRNDVSGFGLDTGVSWQTALPGTPAFTLGYAYGSGDGDPGDGNDRNFRQTGLHNNKWRFFGVNRFRYLGEVLRPELSNLHIFTVAAGLPLLENTSVELVYHRYAQVRAADTLRDVRISADLDGRHTHVGDELNVIVGIREGRHIDLAFTAGVFRAGSAYGDLKGKTAALLMAEFVYFF